jgi:hypothetical protein
MSAGLPCFCFSSLFPAALGALAMFGDGLVSRASSSKAALNWWVG